MSLKTEYNEYVSAENTYNDDFLRHLLRHYNHPNQFIHVDATIRELMCELALFSYQRGRVLEAKFSLDCERMGASLEGRPESAESWQIRKSYGDSMVVRFLGSMGEIE